MGARVVADALNKIYGVGGVAMARILDKVFRLIVGDNRTTDEIITGKHFEGRNRYINGKNFPMRPLPQGSREIVYMEFNCDMTSKGVLIIAKGLGLERPVYEDVLLFEEKYPDEQRINPVVFLHEPWRRWRFSRRLVMVLSTHACGRLALLLIRFTQIWPSNCRFAFIRRSA